MKNILLLFTCVVLFVLSVDAQTKALPKTISGGIINGKATSLPKPDYPEDARRAKIVGVVKVQVLINETGRVVSAKAIEGPESVSLRQESEAAAIMATFSSTLLSGQPVKVSGVITYNFVEKTNEEKLRIFAVSGFLGITRLFAADLEKLTTVFEGEDMFKGAPSQFPEFKELQSMASLEKLTVDKRLEAIEKASTSIQSKLNASERWQFEAGQNFAGVFASLLLAMAASPEEPDQSKIDSGTMKLHLNKMRDLLPSAPLDFPPDVLEKLREFSAMGSKDNFLTIESLMELVTKMGAFIETVSPDSTK